MNEFTLGLDLARSVFDEEPSSEIARRLRAVADQIEKHGYVDFGDEYPIYDDNGNVVGQWYVQ